MGVMPAVSLLLHLCRSDHHRLMVPLCFECPLQVEVISKDTMKVIRKGNHVAGHVLPHHAAEEHVAILEGDLSVTEGDGALTHSQPPLVNGYVGVIEHLALGCGEGRRQPVHSGHSVVLRRAGSRCYIDKLPNTLRKCRTSRNGSPSAFPIWKASLKQ